MKLAVVELQPVEIEAEVEAMTQGGEFDEIKEGYTRQQIV